MNMNPSIKLATILDTIIFKNYILIGKLFRTNTYFIS